MKNICPPVLLLLPCLLFYAAADHITEPDYNYANLMCDLQCHNNGVCRFFSREEHTLQKRMQSGQMVQRCLCPLGYRGMSCDVSVEDDPEDCTGEDAESPRCECAAADKLSVFAGEQCRRPYTNFCASLANSVGGHISFCTNGGKCKGDLIAAERSPGNTGNNYLFQHAGCVCPPEFKGDHCELLNQDFHNVAHQKSNNMSEKGGISILVVCMGALSTLALILVRKVRQSRAILHDLPAPTVQMALSDHYDSDSDETDEDCYRDTPVPPVA